MTPFYLATWSLTSFTPIWPQFFFNFNYHEMYSYFWTTQVSFKTFLHFSSMPPLNSWANTISATYSTLGNHRKREWGISPSPASKVLTIILFRSFKALSLWAITTRLRLIGIVMEVPTRAHDASVFYVGGTICWRDRSKEISGVVRNPSRRRKSSSTRLWPVSHNTYSSPLFPHSWKCYDPPAQTRVLLDFAVTKRILIINKFSRLLIDWLRRD